MSNKNNIVERMQLIHRSNSYDTRRVIIRIRDRRITFDLQMMIEDSDMLSEDRDEMIRLFEDLRVVINRHEGLLKQY